MEGFDLWCLWGSDLIPLFASLFSLVYGMKHFFKKGKPLCLQSITMAMASHALGSVYHLCQSVTSETVLEGFTPEYLGRIGFFLFILTASYGQLDRIVDDGSKEMRPARLIALSAPVCAALLYIPNCVMSDAANATKITYLLVWIPAVMSVYFNLKHAIIPNLDFGFIQALKSYNIFVLCLSFSELLRLSARNFPYSVPLLLTSLLYGILCVSTMIAAKKGVEKWTI